MQRINLLPQELRKDPAVDLKRIAKIAAITTIMGVLVLAFITLIFNNYLKEKEIETIRAEITTLQPKVKKVEALKKEIGINQRKITTYKKILYQSVPWPELLRDIAFNSPTDLWLTEVLTSKVEKPLETADKDSQEINSDTQEQQVKEVDSELYVIIRGYSPTLDSVGVFVLHLNKLSALEDVNIVVAREPKEDKLPLYLLEFEIKAKVKTYQEGGQK